MSQCWKRIGKNEVERQILHGQFSDCRGRMQNYIFTCLRRENCEFLTYLDSKPRETFISASAVPLRETLKRGGSVVTGTALLSIFSLPVRGRARVKSVPSHLTNLPFRYRYWLFRFPRLSSYTQQRAKQRLLGVTTSGCYCPHESVFCRSWGRLRGRISIKTPHISRNFIFTGIASL